MGSVNIGPAFVLTIGQTGNMMRRWLRSEIGPIWQFL